MLHEGHGQGVPVTVGNFDVDATPDRASTSLSDGDVRWATGGVHLVAPARLRSVLVPGDPA